MPPKSLASAAVGAAAGDRITHAGGRRQIARAADGEGEGGVAAVAFGFDRRQGGDRQVGRWQHVIILDRAAGSGRGDRAIAGRAQRHREAFVGFDRGVARDIDGHDLARLADGKVNRTGRQGAAKVVGIGGIGAAAGDRITHAGGRRQIARAADGEGEGGVAAVALGFDRRQGGNRQFGRWQHVIVLDRAAGSGRA